MTYLLLFIALSALIYGPQLWARHVLERYNRREYFSGNGFDLARLVLDRLGMETVGVEVSPAGDHYDPLQKVVRLADAHCGRRTLTAVVVAMHEVGHAIQDRDRYLPLQTRTRMVGTAVRFERIGAALMVGVPLVALIVRVPAAGMLLLVAGAATLCLPVIVHLLTLPTELDASYRRALPLLASGEYIPAEDLPAARRILRACALTYFAGALAGLLNVWRWLRILRR